MMKIDFTGEFFVPGKTCERIEEDHLERYNFACQYAQNKSILDIACGVGYSAPLFLSAGAINYEGVDINDKQIEYARHTYGSDCSKFYVGNICTFNNGRLYDIVTCFETIEHVIDYQSAISNLYNLLNPNGMLFISSPNRPITSPEAFSINDKPSNEFHSQEFTIDELLVELTAKGFIANGINVYGQRQRKIYKNKLVSKIYTLINDNADEKTSPKVLPVNNKVPRYFIIVANKK